MSTDIGAEPARDARTLPLRHILPSLLRDPVNALVELGEEANGEIVRLNLGPFRPYLVTHPDHVQHVLRTNSANYVRDGVFWKSLRQVFGDGIMSTGASWKFSRKVLQSMFTVRYAESLADRMAESIAEELDKWDETIDFGQPINVSARMARVVSKTIIKVFFGDKITVAEVERLIPAFDTISTAVVSRSLMPFMPDSVPLPGDRAFRRALRTIADVVDPLSRKYRGRSDDDRDIFSLLRRARDDEGNNLPDRWVRDNLVAMFATGTETTIAAMTWLWPLLSRHPEMAARLYEEIDHVVGSDPVRGSHLADMPYARRVVQEVVRLYPVGWLLPRQVVETETVGGTTLKRGATLLLSPYITHRLEAFWDRPYDFDPDRFTPERSEDRHRFAYFPFGGGPHICIGMHVFNIEAQLIIVSILSRFRPVSVSPRVVTPQLGASLSPRQRVRLTLRPVA